MAALPGRPNPRRRRPGSFARPINARAYRGAWLIVGIPLLVAAFSVRTAHPLPRPALPPTFDVSAALDVARELARLYPDRRPGSAGGIAAAQWVRDQLRGEGLATRTDRFSAKAAGGRELHLRNIVAEVPGRSPDTIVVMAHRDDTGAGPGANDNASGTAAMIQLARLYASPGVCASGLPALAECPAHRIVFLSTDGGSFGDLGAEHFARSAPYRDRIAAVVNLDAVAGAARPRLVTAGLAPESPLPTLVATAGARVLEQVRVPPRRPSAGAQLLDLAFPFTLYEQGPLLARRISALTLTTGGDRPPAAVGDSLDALSRTRLGQLGRAAEQLVASLDQGLGTAHTTSSAVFLGSRFVPGWAIEIVLIACLLPFFVAVVDLFARCRRRGIALAPAWRSYRSRLGFWLWIAAVCLLLWIVGAWPSGTALPPPPTAQPAGNWPVWPLAVVVVLGVLGWLVARERLLPRRTPEPAELVAGHTVALLALGVVSLLVVALNPFALLFVLPSLHAWLWLPQLGDRPLGLRLGVFAAGLLGPALLVWSLGARFAFGFDAPWYLGLLVFVGYVPLPFVAVAIGWLAAGGQLAALAGGRYAAYPSRRERPPRGPLRELVRQAALAGRRRRRLRLVTPERDIAAERVVDH